MRISRYDRDKAEENIFALEGKMDMVKHPLANLITYAIDYFTNIQKIWKRQRA